MSRDRGSAAVWLAAFAALIGLATTVGVVHGGGVLARHRAETAADLAALAAAVQASEGASSACAAAGDIAARNGGAVTRCVLSDGEVDIEVATPFALGGLGSWTAVARARAGPVDPIGLRT